MTAGTLELLREWLTCSALQETRLVFLTERAAGVVRGESPNLVQGALVGLLRSTYAEHPGRVRLIDTDGSAASLAALRVALRNAEPELALREGSLLAPRLARVKAGEGAAAVELAGKGAVVELAGDGTAAVASDGGGTVLITGGTGGLGALVARHLVAERGVRQLLLVSRGGLGAEGAVELRAALEEQGARVRVEACDVGDREGLAEVIASIPAEHALSTVIHAAGVLDGGVIGSLDGGRLARAMAAKVEGAINLHELAGAAELILFSSAAATLGAPGQAGDAAANAFLDALAWHRRGLGLPALSLAWGAWEREVSAVGARAGADCARSDHVGVLALSDARGLELFDSARAVDRPVLLPVRLDVSALRAQARVGMLPALMRGVVRAPTRGTLVAHRSLAARLAGTPEAQWPTIILQLVTDHVAGVLGHASGAAIEPSRNFKELGFDSIVAIRLRNHLTRATGLQLPAALVFDHPTPAAVAELLRSAVEGRGVNGSKASVPGAAELDLDAEALPDSSIWAPRATRPARCAPAAALLTGATGFLGVHLLHELLERMDGPIRCLVRAADMDDARARLCAAQRAYLDCEDRSDDRLDDRVIPVVGDLAEPLLGCTPEEFARLASTTDVIFHAGALVNHVYPYAQLRDANVSATREILRLACAAEPLPVHYVSTLGALDREVAARGAHVKEDSFVLASDIVASGYVQSKWVADRMVLSARSRGLATSVYRPGLILGHGETGACNTKDTIWRMLRACIMLGAAPAGAVEWFAAPVDFVARAIAELALSTSSRDRAYHLVHPEPLDASTLYQLVREGGHPLEEIPASEWRSRLTSLAASSEDPEIEVIAALMEVQEGVRPEGANGAGGGSDRGGGGVTYECEGAARDLRDTSLLDDASVARSVHASLRYLAETGYLAALPADQREPARG
ncbi:MAG TPA: thioester reductase domain-containing protein [Solirubrobacteraceae bacterium]|nr:thioester reductase domain-containing protein [Solirubrobacteraceae bacterium]